MRLKREEEPMKANDWLAIAAIGATAVAMTGATTPTQAQDRYPSRAVRLVVPFPPGGGTDVMARNLEMRLAAILGQPVVIDNKTGAGGAIGASEVARAKPDGYTLLLGTSSTHVINPLAMDNIPYDAVKSFAPVTIFGIGTYVIVAHPTIAKSLPELVKRLKASPGTFSYGAVSGMALFSGEFFKKQAGVDMLHVPYRLTGQNLIDLTSGQIPLTSTVLSVATPHHRAGKLRILSVFAEKRSSAVPEVPTAIEDGIPKMVAYTFNVLCAPANTPSHIIEVLHQATQKVVRDDGFQKAVVNLGIEPITDSDPKKAAQLVRDELAKWAPIVKAAGVKMN
jgi:tripartite-type tricarboxylate transporter receptor subunit TctC